MTVMNLFALGNDPATRIARVPLEDNVRAEVAALFAQQERDFKLRAESEHIFDGKYKPDFNECLFIDGFDDIDGMKAAVTNAAGVPTIASAPVNLNNIKALFTGRTDDNGHITILLQIFERRRILSTGGFLTLFLESNHYTKFQTSGFTVDDKLSAILEGNKLKFFSFHVARQMFDLSQHYITATDSDITEFSSLSSVIVKDKDKLITNADTWVRRKLALIKQSGVLEEIPISEIKRVAIEFNIDITTDWVNGADAIVLPDEKAQLKSLLRFLDEDYYKSSLRSQPHRTNSKIKL